MKRTNKQAFEEWAKPFQNEANKLSPDEIKALKDDMKASYKEMSEIMGKQDKDK